jgi:hypothetical protein
MGEDIRLSPELFKAIHVSGLPLYQDKAFFDWAASKGSTAPKSLTLTTPSASTAK